MKSSRLFSIAFVLGAVVLFGCTGAGFANGGVNGTAGNSQFALGAAVVQQFVQQHPNAHINVLYLSPAAVQADEAALTAACGNAVPANAYYRVSATENNAHFFALIDAQTQQPFCVDYSGRGTASDTPAASGAGTVSPEVSPDGKDEAKDEPKDIPPFPGEDGTPLPPQPTSGALPARASVVRGNANAAVRIVEYGGFADPYSKLAYPTVQQVLAAYPGQVSFEYRHFPLDAIQPRSRAAALAFECVALQNAQSAWQFYDALFTRTNDDALSIEGLKSAAVAAGANADAYANCVASGQTAGIVDADVQMGKTLGVDGTPDFFINDKELVGAQPFANFKAAIDAQLGLQTVPALPTTESAPQAPA